jgi:hypothetical protein
VVHEGEDGDRVGDQDASLVLQEAVPTQDIVEDVFAWKTKTSLVWIVLLNYFFIRHILKITVVQKAPLSFWLHKKW